MSRIFPIELAGTRVIIIERTPASSDGSPCAVIELNTDASVCNGLGGFAFILRSATVWEYGLGCQVTSSCDTVELLAAAAGLARAVQLFADDAPCQVDFRTDSTYVMRRTRRSGAPPLIGDDGKVCELRNSITGSLSRVMLRRTLVPGHRGKTSNLLAHSLARLAAGLGEPKSLVRAQLTYDDWIQFLKLTPEHSLKLEKHARELAGKMQGVLKTSQKL